MPQQAPSRYIYGEECWFDFDGYRMRYLRAGSGPPVVLIHGLMAYSFSWRFNMEALAREHTVYAVDLLGTGFSDRPPRYKVEYSLKATAERMLQWMYALGMRDAAVVGTSHGGGIALMMASHDRQRGTGLISKVVSVAGVNPWTTRGHTRARVFGHPVGATWFRLMLWPMVGVVGPMLLERMYGTRTKVTRETLEGYRQALLVENSVYYGLDLIKSWRSDLRDLQNAVGVIADMPALLIWGDKDKLVPLRGGRELLQHLRNAELVIMKNVGHLPYEEAPEEFNEILLHFLRYDRA